MSNTCEACGISCEGRFCLRDVCVASRFGIEHPKPKPRNKRVKRLPQHIRPAKMKRKSRVEKAPAGLHRELNQHARDESGQRLTVFRYCDPDKVRALRDLKEQLEKES